MHRQALRRVVHQGVVRRLAGDLHADRAGIDRQARDADKACARGAGLECCPLARRLALRRCCFRQHRHRKVHTGQVQARRVAAAAVDTGKGAEVASAQQQLLDRHRVGRFVDVGRAGQIAQLDVARAAAERQCARDPEEAKGIDRQVARGLEQLASGPVHSQGQGVAGAGGHGQRRLAGRKIDHRVSRTLGLIQLERQALTAEAHPTEARQRNTGGRCLHTGPAARGVVLGAHQCQAELNAGQGDLRTAGRPELGIEILAAQGQQAHIQAGRGLIDRGGRRGVSSQFDGLAVGDECEIAADPEKVAQHQAGARHANRSQASLQIGAVGVGGAGHIDGTARSIQIGRVPTHGRGSGRNLHRLAQRHVGSARGLEQDSAVGQIGIAHDQGQLGLTHASRQITGAHRCAGIAGKHLEIARGCIALKGQVARYRQGVPDPRLQTRDAQHRIGQGAHGAQGVTEATDLKHLLSLAHAGGVEPEQRRSRTDLGEATTTEEDAAAGLELVGVVGVDHQTKIAAVQTQTRATSAHAGADVVTGNPQATGRRCEARRARNVEYAAQRQADRARCGGTLGGVGAVEGVGGRAYAEGAGGCRQAEHTVVGLACHGAQALGKIQGQGRGGQRDAAVAHQGKARDRALGPHPAAVIGRVFAAQPKHTQIGIGEAQTRRAGAAGVKADETVGVFQPQREHVDDLRADGDIVGKSEGGRAAEAHALP